ncbi:hypothetical protein D3C83_135010 [compost metagenome]
MDAMATPLITETAFALLRLPLLRGIAEHIFFARSSFPDAMPIGARRVPAPLRGEG